MTLSKNFASIRKGNLEKRLLSSIEKKKNISDKLAHFYLNDISNNHCKSFFDDTLKKSGEIKDIDLHSYTTIGAEEDISRILMAVDRSRQQIIKIYTGQGSHSQNKVAKLPDIVKKVSYDLNLQKPIKHESRQFINDFISYNFIRMILLIIFSFKFNYTYIIYQKY